MTHFFKRTLSGKLAVTEREDKLHVYLAGPDVFKPNPIEVGKAKKQLVYENGHIGHFPMDPELDDFDHNPETAYKIASGNENLMRLSQVILVNMTPWHGSSMDVGTAFEVGFMSCKYENDPNVLIIGYYEEECEQDFATRVNQIIYQGKAQRDKDNTLRGSDGNSLEEFQLSENLMIPAAIKKTGGMIFMSFSEAVANIQKLWDLKMTKPVQTAQDESQTALAAVGGFSI